MKLRIFAILALLLLAVPARADETPKWVQQAAALKVPSYDKEVPAVVLLDESVTTIGSDGRINEVYVTSYEVKDNELIFKRQLQQQAITIPANDYEMVRKFVESIRTAENAPVVLARK